MTFNIIIFFIFKHKLYQIYHYNLINILVKKLLNLIKNDKKKTNKIIY